MPRAGSRASRGVSGRGCSSRTTSPTGTICSSKQACVGGRRPAPVRLERELVLLLAGDVVALRHVLAGLAHRLEREHRLHLRIRKAPAEVRVVDDLVSSREGLVGLRHHERRARHRLDAARDEEVAVTGHHCVACANDGGQPRCAQSVDGDAGHRLREPGEERGHPRDVSVVFACLVRAAEPHVLDLLSGNLDT